MGGRNAETRPRLDDGGRREADHHRADVPPEHLPTKRPERQRRRQTQGTARRLDLPEQEGTQRPNAASLRTTEDDHAPDFGGHVEHQGHDGGVVVAVNDEAHFAEFPAEVGGVLGELPETVGTWAGADKQE